MNPEPDTAARPTRDDLIALCERGIVPESKWTDRDSAGAQMQLGKAWALLRAGCDFRLASSPEQTEDTHWVEITYEGFDYVEMGAGHETTDLFYLPTASRLERKAGHDWY
jgi:hypothetical protein